MGINRLTHPRTRRVVEHPGRNLKPTVRVRAAQVAAKNNAVRLADRFMNTDPKTKPRMPSVQDFPKLGSVGVLKLCCTIAAGRIRALTAARPITPTSPRCLSAWQPNPAEAPLIDAEKLFRQPGPRQSTARLCYFDDQKPAFAITSAMAAAAIGMVVTAFGSD
jgi:heme A synthase